MELLRALRSAHSERHGCAHPTKYYDMTGPSGRIKSAQGIVTESCVIHGQGVYKMF